VTRIDAALSRLDRWATVALGVVLVAVAGAVVAGIVLRNLRSDITWLGAMTQHLALWAAMLGVAAGGLSDEPHVRMMVVLSRVRGRVRLAFDLARTAISMLFFALLCVYGLQQVQLDLAAQSVDTSSLRVPYYLLHAIFPIAGVLYVVVGAWRLTWLVRRHPGENL
jgi:TRAP-type C4-dicarboxylate transport system permease small subunit